MKLTMPWNATDTHKNGISGKLDDVRRALSDEADHLAAVAANVGEDVGSAAARITGGDAGAQVADATAGVKSGASDLVQNLAGGLAGIGAAIASSGRKGLQDAQELGREAKKLRITTEPVKKGPDPMAGVALLGGFSAGIALMYFLDPEQGKRRRSLFRDQLVKWTRVGREAAAGRAKDLQNRAAGVAHETRRAVSGGASQQSMSDEDTTIAPSGYGEFDAQASQYGEGAGGSGYGQQDTLGQSTDFGQAGTDYGQSTGYGQTSDYDQQNRDEESRIEVR